MMKYDGPKIFKLGIAAAPVIDFSLYNTIYTERYMSTPQKNPEGYKQANVTNYVHRLKDSQKLLILHGDLDDNAHYQNTVQLISALQGANKQFRIMIYPGGKHSLQGTGNPSVYLPLFNMGPDFISENLSGRMKRELKN